MIRTAFAVALIATTGHAVADDSVDTADTVASMWTGGALRLAENDKRFVLAATTLNKGIRIRAEASVPLDDSSRTATFVTKAGIAPAFRGSFHIGYESTYGVLGLTDGDLARKMTVYCKAKKIEPCLESEVEKQIEQDKEQNKKRKRQGQPRLADNVYWGAGLDVSYAYDQTTAYLDDVGAGPTKAFRSTDLQFGASATLYVPDGWALSARAGYERLHAPTLGDFRRCEALPSTISSVTGQTCRDEHYLLADAGPQQSGYARAAAAYYPADSKLLAQYLSAVELRLNGENLATDAASLDTHLLLFAKGLDLGGGSVRVGIGATVRTALASPAGADYTRGDIYDYSLFGIAGTSF